MKQKVRRKTTIVKLFNEQSGRCYYCKRPMTLKLGHDRTATVDHVIPKSKGGPTVRWNLVAACHWDNQRKRDMSADKYKGLLAS